MIKLHHRNIELYPITKSKTASTWSFDDNVVEGQLSECIAKGRSLKNELNYNKDSWTEWTLDAGIVGDSTGLEFTADNINYIDARLDTNVKSSTKYGILYSIPINTTVTGLYMSGGGGRPFSGSLNVGLGNNKNIVTTIPNIVINQFQIYVDILESAGNKVKILGLRMFELPIESEIESDFDTMSADELAQKYPYTDGNGIKYVSENITIRIVNYDASESNELTITSPQPLKSVGNTSDEIDLDNEVLIQRISGDEVLQSPIIINNGENGFIINKTSDYLKSYYAGTVVIETDSLLPTIEYKAPISVNVTKPKKIKIGL